jgi:Sigma-70, region 4
MKPCLCAAVEGRSQPLPASYSCSEQNGADEAIRRALSKVSSWRTPPHWSSCDWHAELRAVLHSGAACASLDYDDTRGVPLRAHIYMRATAAAWTRYRQEWSYCRHSAAVSEIGVESVATPCERLQDDETLHGVVAQALKQLAVEDQWLVEQLFWNGTRQKKVAVTLDVSQQEVSRRKARALRQLRRFLNGHASLLLSRLVPVLWALLDSLDLLPAIDLLW